MARAVQLRRPEALVWVGGSNDQKPVLEIARMRSYAWVGVILLMAGACGGAPTEDDTELPAATVEAREGQTFRLSPGAMARVGRDGLLISFRSVTADSRCAVDVVCVWEGDATARVDVTVGRMAWTPFDLHTSLEPRAFQFRERTVTLVAVEPSPRSDERIDPAHYIITLRVD
jgi:hypothetical protein